MSCLIHPFLRPNRLATAAGDRHSRTLRISARAVLDRGHAGQRYARERRNLVSATACGAPGRDKPWRELLRDATIAQNDHVARRRREASRSAPARALSACSPIAASCFVRIPRVICGSSTTIARSIHSGRRDRGRAAPSHRHGDVEAEARARVHLGIDQTSPSSSSTSRLVIARPSPVPS